MQQALSWLSQRVMDIANALVDKIFGAVGMSKYVEGHVSTRTGMIMRKDEVLSFGVDLHQSTNVLIQQDGASDFGKFGTDPRASVI